MVLGKHGRGVQDFFFLFSFFPLLREIRSLKCLLFRSTGKNPRSWLHFLRSHLPRARRLPHSLSVLHRPPHATPTRPAPPDVQL